MEPVYKYYLVCDISELKTDKARKDLILNDNKYEFIWFAQDASSDRLEALLNDENIDILMASPNAKDKMSGIINGFVDNRVLKNRKLCEFVHSFFDGFSGLLKNTCNDYLDFLMEEHPQDIFPVFESLSPELQLDVLKTRKFDYDTINGLFRRCKKESLDYLLNNESRINLEELNYNGIIAIAEKDVYIPTRLLTPTILEHISTIHDVNQYRFLIEALSNSNDVKQIEEARKRYYEHELSSINEEGLLPEYAKLKQMLNDGAPLDCINECLGDFAPNVEDMNALFSSKDRDETIKRLNDYKISNIVIDYFFEAVPSNILADIEEMVKFQEYKQTLDPVELNMYGILANIDKLSTQDKLLIFQKMKGNSLVEKFYDDYTKTKEMMVDSLNESILNENNISEFKDEWLSKELEVPIYTLRGKPFKALIRGWGQDKQYPLEESEIEFRRDGSSFSIDSSELLNPFQDPRRVYTIAYSHIPKHQLIHAFPTDSYSNYRRNHKLGIPDNDERASFRKIKLMSPEQLTSTFDNYNEVLISVPNATRGDSDFDEKLELPKPIAIYCYDGISQNDILTAQRLGIGIIVVDTKAYNIDRSSRLSSVDTLTMGKAVNSYDYLRKSGKDPRLVEMLSTKKNEQPQKRKNNEDVER